MNCTERLIIKHNLIPNGPGVLSTFTPEEPWQVKRNGEHFYNACADFAIKELGDGNGRSCLVIGSPIFEALQLMGNGWQVTYLDVREPPVKINYIYGDACAMPLADATFDAVSTSCVICHVGLGRYGDPINHNGDMSMLLEIKRVLKPGGFCAINFGPAAECKHTRVLGTMHKVYAPEDINALVSAVGLDVVKTAAWNTEGAKWREQGELLTENLVKPDYLSMLLKTGR